MPDGIGLDIADFSYDHHSSPLDYPSMFVYVLQNVPYPQIRQACEKRK
jgi:hypothetical protein